MHFFADVHPSAPCCTIAGMVRSQITRSWLLGGIAVCLSLLGNVSSAAPPAMAPKASVRILVEPLGFVPPARFFMPFRVPAVTLDFLDATHLLFTFHIAKLMRREAGDPKEDQDQTIRALVLTLPAGKIEAEGTWRLHDRDRYLWALGDGYFLMRKRNTLYIGDKTLTLKDWLHPEGTLASVQTSPDNSTLVAEFATPDKTYDEEGNRPLDAPTLGDDVTRFPEKQQEYSLLVIDTKGRTAKRGGHLHHAVTLPMVEGGYLVAQQGKGKLWDVRLASFTDEPRSITSVTSTCQPHVQPLSEQSFLALSCLPFSSDHLADAYDLQGHKLWEQIWQSRFAWGTFAYSAAGNRFAYGSIEVNHELANLDPVDESSILGQPVGVFNVLTGKPDTVLDATPILTAGENFALSPDGDKLAILRGGAIEIYDLPPLAPANAVNEGSKPAQGQP
jgi:hypothetical protein